MITRNPQIQFGIPTISGTRIPAQTIYSLWLGERKEKGDIPAKKFIANLYDLKIRDIADCIRFCEKKSKPFEPKKWTTNKNVRKAIKNYTGKVTSKECDELWTQAVLKRAKYRCERDGCTQTKGIQAHHIFRRTVWSLRYEIENGIALCVGHHILFQNAAHRDEMGFAKWIETKRDIRYLESKKYNRNKNDYALIKLYLENQLKK